MLSLYLDTSDKLNLAVRNSDGTWKTVITSVATITANTWNYVAFSWSKDINNIITFKLYLNGNMYTKPDLMPNILASTIKNFSGATTSLGMHNSGLYSIKGLMDQFVYSGEALTEAEIGAIRTAGRGNYQGTTGIKNTYTYEDDKIKTVNHNGFSYTFNYDPVGNAEGVNVGSQNLITNVFAERTKLLLSSTYGNGASISYNYDSEDRISSKVTSNGKKYEYSYDANGNLGLLKETVEETVNGTSNKIILDYRYLYDASDRLVKVKESNGNVMTYNYDKGSNLSTFQEKVNGSGYITSYDYDKDNRATDIYYKNPLINGEGTEYFPLNNSALGSRGTKPFSVAGESYAKDTTVTDATINQKRVFTTSSSTKVLYDLGIKKDAGTMGVWFNTNGGTGNRYILASEGKDFAFISMYLDANNKLVLATRGKANEWIELKTSDIAIDPKTWNYAGYTWSVSSGTLNVTLYLNNNSYTASTTNFKDFTGAKTAIGGTNSGANQLNGQLEGLSVYNTELTSDQVNSIYAAGRNNKVNYQYDSIGRLINRILNTGVVDFVTKYSFEAGKGTNTTTRVSEIDNNGSKISYTYDPNGNIQTITSDKGTIDEKIITYYYDGLNQLIKEETKIGGELKETTSYNYDDGGNITLKTITKDGTTQSYEYKYDSTWKDKLADYNGKPITYDAIGNPETYDNYTFTWEQGRQLAGISGNGKNISFKYNVDGIRTEKTVDGKTTTYHLAGERVTYEESSTDKIYYTYDASGNLVSMNIISSENPEINGEYYYIRNAQGDIIGLYDKSGTQVVSYTYDSWGKPLVTDEENKDSSDTVKDGITGTLKDTLGVKNPYRYRGYRYDTETGLYYLQSRYYNPEWGRFINADAIAAITGELLSGNMFAYCLNNGINMQDPNGFRPVFNSDEEEQAYQDWLYEQQEELDKENVKDRLRSRDAKKREKKNVDKAWGKRGSKQREQISEEAHKAKKKYGKGNDDNFGWGDLKGQEFNKINISIGMRIGLGVGGVLLIGATVAEDILTGGVGVMNDGVTISGGAGMIIKAFAY